MLSKVTNRKQVFGMLGSAEIAYEIQKTVKQIIEGQDIRGMERPTATKLDGFNHETSYLGCNIAVYPTIDNSYKTSSLNVFCLVTWSFKGA
jgi:hypothetical protein